MNILRKFWEGGDDVTRAHKELRELDGKSDLGRRNAQKLEAARKTIREHFLKRVLATVGSLGVAAATVAGVLYFKSPSSQDNSVASSAPPQENPHHTAPEKPQEYLPEAAVRSIYDAGFDMLMRNVPDARENTTDEASLVLSVFKKFRKDHVRWATLQGDSINSLEEGNKSGAWVAVIPKDNPLMGQSHPVMKSNRPDMNLLTIKPIAITPEWAGMILLHELVHLYDRMSGYEPKRPSRREYLEGETRAYMIEISGANRITNHQFSRAVRAFVVKHRIRSVDQAFEVYRREGFGDLNAVVTPTPAQGLDEQAMREGLYMQAILIESLAQTGLKGDPLFDATVSVTEELMGRFGAASYMPAK